MTVGYTLIVHLQFTMATIIIKCSVNCGTEYLLVVKLNHQEIGLIYCDCSNGEQKL
jgi:hypothetical protein